VARSEDHPYRPCSLLAAAIWSNRGQPASELIEPAAIDRCAIKIEDARKCTHRSFHDDCVELDRELWGKPNAAFDMIVSRFSGALYTWLPEHDEKFFVVLRIRKKALFLGEYEEWSLAENRNPASNNKQSDVYGSGSTQRV
jgi:hypothetical protein